MPFHTIAYIYMCVCAYIHIYIHVQIHTYTYIHRHIDIYIHIYIHRERERDIKYNVYTYRKGRIHCVKQQGTQQRRGVDSGLPTATLASDPIHYLRASLTCLRVYHLGFRAKSLMCTPAHVCGCASIVKSSKP